METVRLARHAMATRFEIVLQGPRSSKLRAAGEEALDEIERIEGQLSLFRPTSEISYINAYAALRPVKLDPSLYSLLSQALDLSRETEGAFDITVGPLLRLWGFRGGAPRPPQAPEIASVLERVGPGRINLDPAASTIRLEKPGVSLDLGAIGKGFAVERAAEILKEAGVESAIIHGGTSTVYALGYGPEGEPWKIGLDRPPSVSPAPSIPGEEDAESRPLLAVIPLANEALSVSAVWGRSVRAEDQTYGHLLDPRTGCPALAGLMAAVVLPSALETDALSTALLVGGPGAFEKFKRRRPAARAVLVYRDPPEAVQDGGASSWTPGHPWRVETIGVGLEEA